MSLPHPPGRLALAPMDGVTDHVYRDLMTARARKGAIAFCVSEFIRVTDHPVPGSVIRRSCPEVEQGSVTPAGVPVMVQLLGGRAEPLARTALTAIELGAWGVDLNFGCPAKTVNRHDGGASLLKSPERIEEITSRVRQLVPKDRPVSAKIRLGWECSDDVVPLARAAERGGADWLTIHGRTKQQMYGPPADWQAIGRARAAVGMPVIANGDLNSSTALARCQQESGCSDFMLGRGPMGYPSLLLSPRSDLQDAGEARFVPELLCDYLERLQAAGNSVERQIGRVKQWLSLGARVNAALAPTFEGVKRLRERSAVVAALR